MRRKVLTFPIVSAAVLLAAAPAGARPLEGGPYEWQDTYTFDDCGFDIHVDARGHGRYVIRDSNPSTDGQFFRLSDKYWIEERYTNVESGKWIVRTGNGLFTELPPSAVSDGGTVFTYRSIEAGQPFVMRDSEGALLMRDRGAITLEYTFDSLGDSQPGGVQVQDPEVVRIAGPHPGWYTGCEDLSNWLT